MITRMQMPRQLRNKGGITNAVPREKYGLGSKLKERFRKLIPNELADIAVKAAPFVAPFNPGIAGLMRGIGRFDQRGSISDAFKQGLATTAFGAGARALGGAPDIMGGGLRGGFTSPLNAERTQAVKSLFKGGEKQNEKIVEKLGTKKTEGLDVVREASDKVFSKIPGGDKLPSMVKQKLLVGTITSGASALYSYFAGEFDEPQQPGETMGEYMARRNARVKQQVRMYMDSYYTPLRNPEYASLTPEQRDNFIDGIVGQTEIEGTTDYGYATGGRVGYQTGGITMANTLAENIRRNVANQAAFQQAINPSKQKIVERLQKMNPAGTGNFLQGIKDFGKHARAAEAMAGKTNIGVIPEYGMQSSYDFQKKMSGLDPRISSALAKGYQYAQEGARAILDGPGGVTLKDAMKTAKKQSDENIEGIMKAASGEGLTAKQQADRNKFLENQGQTGEPVMVADSSLIEPEPQNQTFTPDSEGFAAYAGIVPGFKAKKRSDGRFTYKAPDGQIYGPDTYTDIAVGKYPDIFDPNKKVIPPRVVTKPIDIVDFYKEVTKPKEEGTIGPITKLPIEPDPDTPIDELVAPIMPTLPVEPMTGQDIMEGFAKFKEQNPGAGAGPGLAVMIYGRLPDGTPLVFGNSAQANAFNQYLESIGQPPFERVSQPIGSKDDSKEKSLLEPAKKLAKGGMPVGIMRTNKAGVMERDYRDKGGFVPVGIKEKADDVPAMLSKNEFVFTADAVRGAGNGSIEKGAQRMYNTMKNLEKRVV